MMTRSVLSCIVVLFLVSFHLQNQIDDSKRMFEDDFEKPFVGEHPSRWQKVKDLDHPAYNDVNVSDEFKSPHSGKKVVKMTTFGKAVSYQTKIAEIIVDPTISYRLSVYAYLAGKDNYFYASIIWRNHKGDFLRVDKSQLVRNHNKWIEIVIDVTNIHKDSRYVQLGFTFEGPDVSSKCYFDTVNFRPQPVIMMKPKDREIPIYKEKESIDLVFETKMVLAKSVKLKIFDMTGNKIEELQTTEQLEAVISPKKAGYYDLLAEISDANGVVHRTFPIIVISPFHYSKNKGRNFGLYFNPFTSNYKDIKKILTTLEMENCALAVWDNPHLRRIDKPEAEEIIKLTELLWAEGIKVTSVLAQSPLDQFPGVSQDITALFSLDKSLWHDKLVSRVKMLSEYTTKWQIGDFSHSLARKQNIDAIIKVAVESIKLGQKSAHVGVSVNDDEIDIAQYLKSPDFMSITLRDLSKAKINCDYYTVIPSLSAEKDRYKRINIEVVDFIKKCISIIKSKSSVQVLVPFQQDLSESILDSSSYPAYLFAVLRTVNDVLSDVEPIDVGAIFKSPVVSHAFLKKSTNEVIIALWRENEEEKDEEEEIYLGSTLKLIESSGAKTIVVPGDKIRIGKMPVFLVGIHPRIMQLLNGLNLYDSEKSDKPLTALPMKTGVISNYLKFANRLGEDISNLRISIIDYPRQWNISGKYLIHSKLSKNESVSKKIDIKISRQDEPGPYELLFELSYLVNGKSHTVKLSRVLELKPMIEILTHYEDVRDAKKVRINLRNNTNRRVDLQVTIRLPGLREQRVNISGFSPGEWSQGPLEFTVTNLHKDEKKRLLEVLVEEPKGERLFSSKIEPIPLKK